MKLEHIKINTEVECKITGNSCKA